MPDLALSMTKPVAKAAFKQQVQDFVVIEQLGWEPEGAGEHIYLWLTKTAKNTRYVMSELARYSNIAERNISYSGLKDKQAVTSQWFSLHVPGKQNIDWDAFNVDGVKIEKIVRHNRKLRRGTHKTNRFIITVKDIRGDSVAINKRLSELRGFGFPNFFGPQRFGFNGNNLTEFERWIKNPKKKPRHFDLYLSAARSHLFNKVLAVRQNSQTWNEIVVGELAMLDGTSSVFEVAEIDTNIVSRCRELDIHPTAPLWGKGESRVGGDLAQMERSVVNEYKPWGDFFTLKGLKQERRAMRALAKNLVWQWLSEDSLKIEFELVKGCYATSFLAEVFDFEEEL